MVTSAVRSSPSLAPHLHRLMQVTGADVVFGGLAPSSESLVVLDTFVGARSNGLRNLALTEGFGLGGKVIQTGQPLRVRDYRSARGITHHYDQAVESEELRAILAVPVRSTVGVHGVVYAGLRQPVCIGDRTFDRAVAVARGIQHAIVVEAEVNRRLSGSSAAQPAPAEIEQRLRDVHAELGVIRNGASGRTRQLIEELMHRLSGGAEAVPCGVSVESDAVSLSRRELDVITQAAVARRNAEISADLGLSEGTVKAYLHSAMRKLGAKNRVEAALTARRLGLIP